MTRRVGWLLALFLVGPAIAAPAWRLPLHFVRLPEGGYLARGQRYEVAVDPDGLTLRGRNAPPVRLALAGARPAPLSAAEPLALTVNGYQGSDPARWRNGLPTWGRLRQAQPWPGIDLIYYGRDGLLEYDLLVAPGAEPRAFGLRVEGVTPRLDASGEVLLGLARLKAPVAWQTIGGRRQAVRVVWQVGPGDLLRLKVGAYDRRLPLVIDPLLTYASYVGGNGWDQIRGMARDAGGNLWVVGSSYSTDLAGAGAAQSAHGGVLDIFVAKFSAAGTPLVASYLGGAGFDNGTAVACDAAGNVYVLGSTNSPNLPLQQPLQSAPQGTTDLVVASFSSTTGTLRFSTYWGGDGQDMPGGLRVDSAGNLFLSAGTASSNMPVLQSRQASRLGAWDAYVARMTTAGGVPALAWGTYLGGSGDDRAFALGLDSQGRVLLAGATGSADFPTANPAQATLRGGDDAFVTQLSADGSQIIQSSYLGGTGTDAAYGVAADGSGALYVAGAAASADFPLVQPLHVSQRGSGSERAFLAKINRLGGSFDYATTLGGSGSDHAQALAVDAFGRVCLTGATSSTDFPTAGPLQSTFGGGINDAFLALLTADGASLGFSTYFGGSGNDSGSAVLLTDQGLAALAGSTTSHNLRTLNPARPGFGDTGDGFLALIDTQDVQAPGLTIYGLGLTRAGNTVTVPLRIEGYGFQTGATARLTATGQEDINASGVQVAADGRSLTCSLDLRGRPAGVRGVVVTNPGGASATLAAAFTIETGGLQVTAAVPNVGYTDGPVTVELNGTGFVAGCGLRLLRLGETPITGTGLELLAASRLRASFDLTNKAAGAWDVELTGPAGEVTLAAGAFTTVAPAVTAVTPATIDNLENRIVTLQGVGLRTSAALALERNGIQIPLTDLALSGEGAGLAARIALSLHEPGSWDLVYRSGSYTSRLAGAVTLVPGVRITAVAPSSTYDNGRLTLRLDGQGLTARCQVALQQNGQDVATAWAWSHVIGYSIGTEFDAFRLPVGVYDLVVRRTDGYAATVAGGFTVNASPITITTARPNEAVNRGDLTLSIRGSAFAAGRTVSLVHPNGTVVTATAIRASEDGTELLATFGLTGAPAGLYDLVVARPEGQSARLAAAVTVAEAASLASGAAARTSAVSLAIQGGGMRVGRRTTISIVCSNRGTMNARGSIVIRGIPRDVEWELGGLPPPALDGHRFTWQELGVTIERPDELILSIPNVVVPPGDRTLVNLMLTVPTERQFNLTAAWIGS